MFLKSIGVSEKIHVFILLLALNNTLEIVLRDTQGGDHSKSLKKKAIDLKCDGYTWWKAAETFNSKSSSFEKSIFLAIEWVLADICKHCDLFDSFSWIN